MAILYENRLNSSDDLKRFADEKGVYYAAWLGNPYLNEDIFIDLVDNPVHSEPFSCRIRVTKPWLNTTPGDHRRVSVRVMTMEWLKYYAVCWHYFPSSYKVTKVGQLMAQKEYHCGVPGQAWRLTFTPSYNLRVVKQLFADTDGVKDEWADWILSERIPLDTWFRTEVECEKHPTDGIIAFYLNGREVWRKQGIETLRDISCPQWVTVHFNYVQEDETIAFTNYFDDVTISDEFIPMGKGYLRVHAYA